jgi:Zn-dependent membrane protease YugP
LIIPGLILGIWAQSKVKSTYAEYSRIPTRLGRSAAAVVDDLLRRNGNNKVRIGRVSGELTDHYNPSDRTVNLSESVYNEASVAAMAVAAHECGHAIQQARAYPWLGLRSSLVPMVNIGSRLGQVVLFIGLALLAAGSGTTVAWIGLALYAATTVFALVTLPVEFDASRRALAWIEQSGWASRAMHGQAGTALRWAAMTYVAAALSSLAMLLYYALIILSRMNSNRD